ncbi:MAG: TonB-dependent receptor [Terriglobia bacterium]|nr:TonB-dependent receptor [Terriglobia bacterium]
MLRRYLVVLVFLMYSVAAYASLFGTVRAIVHDPQHRGIADAQVKLQSENSAWFTTAKTNSDGVVQFLAVPIGRYRLEISAPGFAPAEVFVASISDRIQEVHVPMELPSVQESVSVFAAPPQIDPTSSTSQTNIPQAIINRLPGADRTNSLAFVTDTVPGAVMVHDQLHIRGGHQVTWAIDGVPVPNTNIASNVGPQFDPKDVDLVEIQRGGMMADYGDRTYGVFNVAPRSGFERNNEAELLMSYGNFNQTDDQFSIGSHTDQFAYYASINANRTDHALETPTPKNVHDQGAGGGAFTSLTYNTHSGDQWRLVGSVRSDFFQVPYDPGQPDLRDGRDREQDALGILTYLHPFGSSVIFTISPFFHFNRAAFEGGPNDIPSATDNRASTYAGGQMSLGYIKGRNNAKTGLYAFGQHDNQLFGVVANDGTGNIFRQRNVSGGNLEALFMEDQFKAFNWLTLNGGVRLTHFAGAISENAASPRLGAALRIPKLSWVLRASYSRFYQPPPLTTIAGPLLELVAEQGAGFLMLRGERDEQHEFGITIPVRGWTLDADTFRTGARNFFDHDALGNSNIFFPLAIDRVRIRGEEVTLHSPTIAGHANFHLAYSHQSVEGYGAITGGLTDFSPPEQSFFYLDHDQRDTLTIGADVNLSRTAWLSSNYSYGSGFLNGDGPSHLPPHNTVDLAIGKSFGESWSAKFSMTNLADSRYFIDLSNAFGGSHVADPRQISVQIRYKFHY